MTKPKAYSYVRFSSPEQQKGHSFKRQQEASAMYAQENGLDLDEQLRDEGISAFQGDNVNFGALGEFLKMVKEKKVPPHSVLIVESLDRLSRETVYIAQERFLSILNAEIDIVTLIDKRRYSNSNSDMGSLFQSIMIMCSANNESEQKSQRGKATWRWKREQAGKGVIQAQITPGWLKVVKLQNGVREIVEDPAAVQTVKRIFDLSAGGLGQMAIARLLTKEGVRRFDGNERWFPSTVGKILRSRAVLGEYTPHIRDSRSKRVAVGDPIVTYYPAIIKETQFLSVGAAITKRRRRGGRKGTQPKSLFTHLMHCAHCKGSIVFKTKNGRGYSGYLVCQNARLGGDCFTTGWRYEAVERLVLRWLATERIASDNASYEIEELEKSEIICTETIELLGSKIKNIVEAISLQSSAALSEKLNELESQRDKVQRRQSELKSQVSLLRSEEEIETISDKEFERVLERLEDSEFRLRIKNELGRIIANMSMTIDGESAGIGVGERMIMVLTRTGRRWYLPEDGVVGFYENGRWLVPVGADSGHNLEDAIG